MALGACLFGALSCSEFTDEGSIIKGDGEVELVASFEMEDATRTSISVDSSTDEYSIKWSDADEVAVLSSTGTTPKKYTLSSGSGNSTASFTGTVPSGTAPYYAVFPYSGSARISGGVLTFPVEQQKGAYNGNVAKKSLPAARRIGTSLGSTQSITLTPIFGLLKVTLKTSSETVQIKKMTLQDLGGNILWGTCNIPVKSTSYLDYDNVTVTGGTNVITMVWNTPTSLNPTTARNFYFPVPPGSLDRGFSLILYEYDEDEDDGIGDTYTFLSDVVGRNIVKGKVSYAFAGTSITARRESRDEKARGYYKTLFVDGGYGINHFALTSDIPAISYLGLGNDYEYYRSDPNNSVDSITCVKYQNNILVNTVSGSASNITWNDHNGVLLYPDGQPRFRFIYMNGGKSTIHGRSLTQAGRDNFHNFFENGGSYVGTCAGSFLASTRVDGTNRYNNSNPDKNFSFGIWPGNLNHTHLPRTLELSTVYTCMKVLPALKSTNYYDFATRDTVEDVRHHGGSYLPHDKYNQSVNNSASSDSYKAKELLSYRYSSHSAVSSSLQYKSANSTKDLFKDADGNFVQIRDSVSTWSYKASAESGRAVLTGSHPERNTGLTQKKLFSMMFRHAMAGNGSASADVKSPDLTFGTTRSMTKLTTSNNPDYTKIGDGQYHHFKFTTTSEKSNVKIELSCSESNIDLYLGLRKGNLAWLSDADYSVCTSGANKTLNIHKLPMGTWYVSVYCATKVNATLVTSNSNSFFKYSGKTVTINGVPYTVKLSQ